MRPVAQRADSLKQWLITGSAIAAGLVMLYGLLVDRGDEDLDRTTLPDERGYYLTDAVLSEMGLDGKPRIVMHARSAEQQTSDDSVRMKDLTVDYSGKQTGKWHVTARQGQMTPDRTTLLLSGDVRVTGDESHGSAVITSDAVSYDTRANLVQTPEPVNVLFGRHVLNGRGLHADLNAGTLKLESNVNGRFTP
jgi:LPS export ABC transporter protein LptC